MKLLLGSDAASEVQVLAAQVLPLGRLPLDCFHRLDCEVDKRRHTLRHGLSVVNQICKPGRNVETPEYLPVIRCSTSIRLEHRLVLRPVRG